MLIAAESHGPTRSLSVVASLSSRGERSNTIRSGLKPGPPPVSIDQKATTVSSLSTLCDLECFLFESDPSVPTSNSK